MNATQSNHWKTMYIGSEVEEDKKEITWWDNKTASCWVWWCCCVHWHCRSSSGDTAAAAADDDNDNDYCCYYYCGRPPATGRPAILSFCSLDLFCNLISEVAWSNVQWWPRFIEFGQKFGWPLPPKFGGTESSKFQRNFGQLHDFIASIYLERNKTLSVGKWLCKLQTLPHKQT